MNNVCSALPFDVNSSENYSCYCYSSIYRVFQLLKNTAMELKGENWFCIEDSCKNKYLIRIR